MHLENARRNMIQGQLIPYEIQNEKILKLFGLVSRESFVPKNFRLLAYMDSFIPIGQGQVMLPPKMEARLLEAANINHTETVLEIGTGYGYTTAMLARLAHYVMSVEIFPDFSHTAQNNLRHEPVRNIVLEIGDASEGWRNNLSFDVIYISAGLPFIPKGFYEQLAIGGRIIAFVGSRTIKQAKCLTRIGPNRWQEKILFETEVPNIQNLRVSEFSF